MIGYLFVVLVNVNFFSCSLLIVLFCFVWFIYCDCFFNYIIKLFKLIKSSQLNYLSFKFFLYFFKNTFIVWIFFFIFEKVWSDVQYGAGHQFTIIQITLIFHYNNNNNNNNRPLTTSHLIDIAWHPLKMICANIHDPNAKIKFKNYKHASQIYSILIMSRTVKGSLFGSCSTNIVLCTVSSKRKFQKKKITKLIM